MNEYQSVSIALAPHAEAIALELLGEPVSRSRHEWRWGLPDKPHTEHLKVTMAGPRRGWFVDFMQHTKGSQDGFCGDLLTLAAMVRFNGNQRAALEWAQQRFLGHSGATIAPATLQRPPAPSQGQREPSSTSEAARLVWRQGVAPGGTLAERYLASRGLALEPEHPIRFHPQCRRGDERLPAMLALMTDPITGEPCGVHRTFLARDGSGKAPGQARGMLGNAGVIRLSPDEDVTEGLHLCEGIETGLAAAQHFGLRPTWAATSAGMVRAFPVLEGIGAFTLLADGDDTGLAAAEACAARWSEAGREVNVMVPPAGLDLNDLHRGIAA